MSIVKLKRVEKRCNMLDHPPTGWEELWVQAQNESDTQKLAALIEQMNALLAVHEAKTIGLGVRKPITANRRHSLELTARPVDPAA